jgi:Family of unknown function (DUF6151)
MGMTLRIRCVCGALQGEARDVAPEVGNHAVCYCNDCQAFAHFLGRSSEVLDSNGGTEIFQMSPALVRFTAGTDRLGCVRLTDKGLRRWYAACCRTPIGNTMASGGMAFVGVLPFCFERPADDPGLQRALGPILVRAFRRYAKGDASVIPADRILFALDVLRLIRLLLWWKLRGDSRRSPFFDPQTGRPTVEAKVLDATELSALRSAVARA